MKNIKSILFILLAQCLSLSIFAQAPDLINYQAVARNSTGNPIQSQVIGIKISVLQGSATGTAVYEETHAPTTDNYGAFNLAIGGGTVVSGGFSGINWGSFTHYLKIEMDAAGGSNYTPMGTTQMVSVPYAKYAEKAGSVTGGTSSAGGKTFVYLVGDITDVQAAAIIASDVGPNTQIVRIENTTQLTTVDLSALVEVGEIWINDNQALTSINLNNLEKIYNFISIRYNESSFTSLSFPKLDYARQIAIEHNSLASFSAPLLVNGYLGIESDILASMNIPLFSGSLSLRGNNSSPINTLNISAITKGEIHIEGFPSLTILNLANMTKGDIYLDNIPSLSTLTTTNITSLNDLNVVNCNALTILNFPSLTTVEGSIYLDALNSLSTLSMPVLTTIDNRFEISSCAGLASLNFSNLTTTGRFYVSTCAALSSINLSSLTSLSGNGGLSLGSLGNLTSLNVSALSTAASISLYRCTKITSVNFPALTSLTEYSININENDLLTSIGIANLSSITDIDSYMSLNQNALTSASVNALLAQFVSLSPALSGANISLAGQTPAAPPTGQGLTDKATLQVNNSVSTD